MNSLFVINNLPYCALPIGHKGKYIEEAVHLKISWYSNW